jgi:nucleoside 2-deoxyribosyltransferase
MNVYFTASIVGKKHHIDKYQRILSILRSKGLKIQSDHIINTSESQIRMETRNERLKFQNQLEKMINAADCVIAETSFPSISVGYEISLALHRGKPVLILYSEGEAPSLLAQHKDEKLICEKYNSDNVKGIIEDFMSYVEGSNDMRFTFFITSTIASYLEKISRTQKIPKSVYLRKLIEEDMQKTH